MKGSRLKELREKRGLYQSELAKLLHISSSSIGMYETDKRDPSDELKVAIANFFGVSVDYLMGDDISKNNLIPVLGIVKAGYNYLAEQNIVDYIEAGSKITDTQNYFGLLVKGDSMAPSFDDGDYVIVRKTDGVFETGDVCVVLMNGDEGTIKKVIKTDVGIELHAFNPYYPVKKYTFEEMKDLKITILGVVIRQIRNWK